MFSLLLSLLESEVAVKLPLHWGWSNKAPQRLAQRYDAILSVFQGVKRRIRIERQRLS